MSSIREAMNSVQLQDRLTRAEAVVEACVAWQEDSGECLFDCGFLGDPLPCAAHVEHDADCPLVVNGYVDRGGQRRKGER